MITNDHVSLHLDVIARWLEGNGYAIEVDYATACIVVWLENWPLVLELKHRRTAQPSEASPTTLDHEEHFRPGKPEPTHRDGEAP